MAYRHCVLAALLVAGLCAAHIAGAEDKADIRDEVAIQPYPAVVGQLLAMVTELKTRLETVEAELKATDDKYAQLLEEIAKANEVPQADSGDADRALPRKLAASTIETRLAAVETKVKDLDKKVTGFTSGTGMLDVFQICIGQTCLNGGDSLYFRNKATKNPVVQINHRNYDVFQVFPVPADNTKWFFVNQVYQFGFWDRIAKTPLGMAKMSKICTVPDEKCPEQELVKKVNALADCCSGGGGGDNGGEITADKVCIGVTCLEAEGDSLKLNHKDSGHTLAEFSHAGWDRFKVFPDDDSDNYYFFVDTSYRFGFWDEANYTPYGTCSATGFVA